MEDRALDELELTPAQEKAYAELGLRTVADLLALDPEKLSEPVRKQSRELLSSMGLDFGQALPPPAPPIERSPLEQALFAALESGSPAAFTRALEEAWAPPSRRDREAVLGLSSLALGHVGRGQPEGLVLIDAVLERWPILAAPERLMQVDDFLRSALAAAGSQRATVARLAQLAADSSDGPVLFNLACAWSQVGDEALLLAALTRAFAAGVRPGQVAADADFAKRSPAVQALLDAREQPSEAFDIQPHLPAMERALAEIAALCREHSLESEWRQGASQARILEAEQRAGGAFPNEYRALLSLHDGGRFQDIRILGAADFLEGSGLYQKAREFIDMSARYGTPELLESVPLANLGQPNSWLVYDARRQDGRFVVWMTADDLPMESLEEALSWQAKVLEDMKEDD